MSRTLEWRSALSILKLGMGQAVTLFVAAGTLRYWQAYLYLCLQVGSSVAVTMYLLRHDRQLMARRLALEEEGETLPLHRLFARLLPLLGGVILLVCGLDFRFGWSAVATPWVVSSSLVFSAGVWIIFATFRENHFASSVIEVTQDQRVIDSGPYRWVRHPMYAGAVLSLAAMPLVLGSYRALLAVPPLLIMFIVRLMNEERFLAGALPGYGAYLQATPYRLIPRVW